MGIPCGGIYNDHIIANCLQSASERILKIVNNWRKYGKGKVARFLWPTVYIVGRNDEDADDDDISPEHKAVREKLRRQQNNARERSVSVTTECCTRNCRTKCFTSRCINICGV